jgi:hypothetical protein
VWLSRKGAIDASEGKPGLIPMADAADLVEIRHVLRQIVNVKGE